ncbi:MAG: hypothetical protein GX121_00925 [Ignavibacteria bacterium]|jgi:anionic cell wall polymer biosynthesis LytR-Cps2A-Psr (LCP) family protein|nr:hypothetical protein [Ignavibacteria bacterium]
MKKKKNSYIKYVLILFTILILFFILTCDNKESEEEFQDLVENEDPLNVEDSAALDQWVDSSLIYEDEYIVMSSPHDAGIMHGIDDNAGKNIKRIYNGRRINIALTGLDSRMGRRDNHADANHVLSILIDSGQVEIFSIPRDTYADAGFDDTTGQNKLTVVRAAKGRKTYLKELARIAGLDRVHYFMEVGFSQFIGLVELFGVSNSHETLQVLRSRKGLGGDDYQRVYNQGQFIAQMIYKHFGKFSGFFQELLVRGGLLFIDSDLDASTANDIINALEKKGFPKSREDLTVKIKPPIPIRYKVYDFTDENVVNSLHKRIVQFNKDSNQTSPNVPAILNNAINKAVNDSTNKRYRNVFNNLRPYFNQRAWSQVADTSMRRQIRHRISMLLIDAYKNTKNETEAQNVLKLYQAECELYKSKF